MTDPSTPSGHRPPPVAGQWADRLAGAVYVAVALVALVGQSLAAVHWLRWPLIPAMAAVAVVELAAVAVSARADYRRRLGESAVAARVLSALIAAFMCAVNFAGHWLIGQQVAAWFFAGTTLVGYLIWLLHSAARRRDALRDEGKLDTLAPVYGGWQWLRHPVITSRARDLAMRDPDLGLYGSLDAATAELHRARRNRALARAVRRRVRSAVDGRTARIATLTYDMDAIASRLSAGADYDGLTALVAEDLTPARLAGNEPANERVIDGQVVDPEPASGDTSTGQVVPIRRRPVSRRRSRAATTRAATGSTPTVDALADTLCREHCRPAGHPVDVGKPTALRTLVRVYGSCGGDRAKQAKDVHNRRHSAGGQVDADDDDREGDSWAV